jgi:hypothetical protein
MTAPSGRTVIGDGPPDLPGSHARPNKVEAVQSDGRAASADDDIAIERFGIIETAMLPAGEAGERLLATAIIPVAARLQEARP